MSFVTKLLQKTGILAKIIASKPEPPQNPFVVAEREQKPTQKVSLTELRIKDASNKAKALQEQLQKEIGFQIPLDMIFETAQLKTPTHGWTVVQVADFLEEAKAESPQESEQRLLLELAAAKVPVLELLQDAAKRDNALDLYEEYLLQKTQKIDLEIKNTLKDLEDKLVLLQTEIAQKKQEQVFLQDALLEWQEKKKILEKRWSEALVPLASIGSSQKISTEESSSVETKPAEENLPTTTTDEN